MYCRTDLTRKPALSSSGKLLFLARAELCLTCVTSLQRAPLPEGERMSFCNQTAAAIDGARTLTRLDHLSKAIWQASAAGAVADDDAQSLAERLHARRGILRGEIKPVGIPSGRPSIFPPRRVSTP